MIIIVKLDYYDDTHKTIPIEAESVEDAYEKVRGAIYKYNKDCNEYWEWRRSNEYINVHEDIILEMSSKREQRKQFVSCEGNYDIDVERIKFFEGLDKIDNEIDELYKKQNDLINSRREPRESDYANFRIRGLGVSDYDFKTLEEWLEQKGEVY